jgi:hypothetical protein
LFAAANRMQTSFMNGFWSWIKKNVKILPAELSTLLFDIPVEIKIVLYTSDSVDFEILLIPGHRHVKPRLEHVCIITENIDSLLKKSTNAGLKTLRVPKGSSVLYFIEDFDGNLFEIKEIR